MYVLLSWFVLRLKMICASEQAFISELSLDRATMEDNSFEEGKMIMFLHSTLFNMHAAGADDDGDDGGAENEDDDEEEDEDDNEDDNEDDDDDDVFAHRVSLDDSFTIKI